VGGFVSRWVGRLVRHLVSQVVGRSAVRLVGGFLGGRVDCSFSGLVGQSIEWLVGLGGCLDDLKTRETFSLAEIDR
jgi:hypothetical protein